MERLRIFISSPADVGAERAVAAAVIERLQLEFRGLAVLETYLWERSLLLATETFQSQILDIRKADLAVFILWSRIGMALPEEFQRADGSRYASGTEYEFEHARAGYESVGQPEIIFYLKTADLQLSVRDRARREQQTDDLDAVNRFVENWFRNDDGTFKSAYREFEHTARFEEQFEHHLRDWLRRRVRGVERGVSQQWSGSPFRGLQPFDFEHALIYCGRTGLITEVIDALRQRAGAGRGFLMIIGMSGAGKSSLVRAGVLPMLARPRVVERVIEWRRAVFRPSDNPQGIWASFAAALRAQHALPDLAANEAELALLLRQPIALVAAISSALDRVTEMAREHALPGTQTGDARLILVIDQFEELFDEDMTPEERGGFADTLTVLAHSGRVWVLATLRADLYGRCADLPQTFRDLLAERGGVFTVVGPRPPEVAQMIRQPAAMAGVSFERRGDPEEGLDEVLRDAAAEHPSVLPLLEFTLDELWKRSKDTRMLRFSDYDDLGGLYGALRQRADEEFARLPQSARDALDQLLSAVVRIDPSDERLIVESRVTASRFDGTPCQALIGAFTRAHLLVADRAPDGTPVIGLAHEALLREWPPAVQWIELNKERLRLRAGIAAAAALWRDSRQREDRLLSGTVLRDAVGLATEAEHMLGAGEHEFVTLSRERERKTRRQRIFRGTVAAFAVAMAVLLPIIGLGQLSYATSVLEALSSVWEAPKAEIPISQHARDDLRADIGALAAYLRPRIDEMGVLPEFNPWAVAQTWAALYGLEPSLPAQAPKLRAFMTQQRDPKCICWRETDDKLPHTIATAWVLYSLALYDQPAEPEEIAALLNRQGAEGWWAMFPSTPDPRNASTAATAWASLALHAQLSHHLIAASQQERTAEAISRADDWLQSHAVPGRARWNEYAPEEVAEKNEDYLAVSGFTMHAMRTDADVSGFDHAWLAELPRRVPGLTESETAKGQVFRSKNQFTLDDVRHYRFPWMLKTTVDAYPNGTNLEKARALVWIENALGRPLTTADFHTEEWTIAETVFVLRQIAEPLRAKPQ